MKFIFLFLSWSVFSGAALAQESLVYMVENANEKQVVLDPGDGTVPAPITSGERWHLYPEIDRSGRWVIYVEGDGGDKMDVMRYDTTTKTAEKLLDCAGRCLHPTLSGDGAWFAVSGPFGKKSQPAILVSRLSAQGLVGERKIIESDYPSYFPALSSDGGFLVYQSDLSKIARQIVRYDFDSKKSVALTPAKGMSMAPALSFDDRQVAFTQKVDGDWEVFSMSLNNKLTARLTNSAGMDLAPTFRRDDSIVFASNRLGVFALFEIPVSSILAKKYEAKLLTQDGGTLYHPRLSGLVNIKQALFPAIPKPARSSFGGVRVGNRVFVIGGHQGMEHTYPPESFLSRVDIFDLGRKEWTEGTPRPNPAHGYGVVAYGKYIYAFGGFAYAQKNLPNWKSLQQIDRYDTEKNVWQTVAMLPRARSSNVTTQIGDKVYLIGGWDSTPRFPKDFEGVFHPEIDVFDLKTEKVEVSPYKLAAPLRRAFTGVLWNNEIILAGGISQGASHFNLIDNVTAFNPQTGAFRDLPKLPAPTFAPAAGVVGNSLYVFGGMFRFSAEEFNYVNHIFVLNQDATRFEHSGRYLSEAKGFSQVVDLPEGAVGILGGHSYGNNTNAPVGTFERFEVK